MDAYPLRFIYLYGDPGNYPARMVISVPKRLHKNAVDRNLLKRRVREAYRLQKLSLYEQLDPGQTLLGMIQYKSKKKEDFKTISAAWTKILKMLEKRELSTYNGTSAQAP